MTHIFTNLKEVSLPTKYDSMDIQSNFISNVNVLLIPLFILPILYFPLNYFGDKSNNIHTKPRCKKYGKAFLLEVPLVILLFSSFNIYSSFYTNMTYIGL